MFSNVSKLLTILISTYWLRNVFRGTRIGDKKVDKGRKYFEKFQMLTFLKNTFQSKQFNVYKWFLKDPFKTHLDRKIIGFFGYLSLVQLIRCREDMELRQME